MYSTLMRQARRLVHSITNSRTAQEKRSRALQDQRRYVPKPRTNDAKTDVLGISKRGESAAVKRLPFLALFATLAGLTSCHKAAAPSTAITCTTATGSGSSSTSTCTDPVTNITLTIAPATVSVNVVTPQQFLYSLSGGTNNSVTWQVNKIPGGNPTVGIIDSNGKYIAPSQVPSPATVTVAAVSFEDRNLSASSTVTVVPAPLVKITSPTPPITVKSGAANKINFQATVTGGTLNTVTWEVGTIAGAGGAGDPLTIGTIDTNGVYSPPFTPPIGSTVFVTAVSNDSASSFASVPVTISGYSTSSLQGQFAFSISGKNASGAFVRAGSFVADGAGNLNSGAEDVNSASGATATPISFAGTYTVAADGRGTLKFSDGLTPASFNFVLVNGSQLQIIGFDSTGTATGQANAVVASTFAGSPMAALFGTYVFDFAGTHGSNGLSEIGEFTADGAGNFTGGLIDINDGGTLNAGTSGALQIFVNPAQCQPPNTPPATLSSYSISSNGRGTLTLVAMDAACQHVSSLTFAFYVVTRGSAKFVGTGTDATERVSGKTAAQVVNSTFSQASLNGNYAFLLSGSGSGGAYASAGSFLANGLGSVASGVLDQSVNGMPLNMTWTGAMLPYSVNSTGRGTLSLTGGRTYVFYMGPAGTAVFQETDTINPTIVSDGTFAQQQNPSFALSQLAGNYAIETADLSSATPDVVTGDLGADGAGHISSGAVDVNTAGTTNSDVAIVSTSSYSTSSPAERGAIVMNLAGPLNQTRTFALYVVGPLRAFVVETDSGHTSAGALLKQF